MELDEDQVNLALKQLKVGFFVDDVQKQKVGRSQESEDGMAETSSPSSDTRTDDLENKENAFFGRDNDINSKS